MAFSKTFLTILSMIVLSVYGESTSNCDDHFCFDKPEDYPQEHFDKYVIDLQSKGLLEKKEATYSDTTNFHTYKENIDGRNCATLTKLMKPFEIKTNSTQNKLVVQTDVFEQTLYTTRCKDEGKKCFEDLLVDGHGITTACTTKYGSVTLYVYNKETKNMERLTVDVPVCCTCNILKT